MLVSSFLVISNVSHTNNPVDEFLSFITVFAIFYWLYKVFRILYKITEEKDNYYYGGTYDLKSRTKPDSEYYKRYQPNSKHTYDSKADEKKRTEAFAEKISTDLVIRSDIKILEFSKKKKK